MASISSSVVPRGATVKVARQRKLAIGAYRIQGRPLGRGGSATVYRVLGSDGREYAVKELAPQFLGDKEAVTRFRREFEIARDLAHPGIVRNHELIEANGTLNIRMELVDGLSLKALMSRHKRLEPPLACWLALQVARTLAHAHSQQVIHRDVKPENILLDRDGHVLLGDFGTARLVNLAMTKAGTLLGTPAYMAPELLAAKKDSGAGPASDVYSLGAVLYEMIEGRSPFTPGTRGEILPLLYAKSFQRPRPMARSGSPELAALIERCLAREPANRPAGMLELIRLLDPYSELSARNRLLEMMAATRQPAARKGRAESQSQADEQPSQLRSLPPGRSLSLHDSRFAAAFFLVLGVLIVYLLTLPTDPGVHPGPNRPALASPR
jgi:serine/threonine-protein kinase